MDDRRNYHYELYINGAKRRDEKDKFRTGIISKIVEDIPKIERDTKEFIIKVKRVPTSF